VWHPGALGLPGLEVEPRFFAQLGAGRLALPKKYVTHPVRAFLDNLARNLCTHVCICLGQRVATATLW